MRLSSRLARFQMAAYDRTSLNCIDVLFREVYMEYRQLGRSGFKVPVLCFGTATFVGSNESFKGFGDIDVAGATRIVDICLDAGLTMFDSADIYAEGNSEEILGRAIKGRRD